MHSLEVGAGWGCLRGDVAPRDAASRNGSRGRGGGFAGAFGTCRSTGTSSSF